MLLLILIALFSSQALWASNALSPMSYEDIVTLEKPSQVAVSSAGRVVFTVQKANIDENKNSTTVYVWEHGPLSQKLWELDSVRKLEWHKDTLYALTRTQILSFQEKTRVLHSTPSPIHAMAIDAVNGRIYYTQTRYTSDAVVQKSKEEGYVYRWEEDNGMRIGNRKYAHPEWEEIWCLDLSTGGSECALELSYKNWSVFDDPLINDLRLSEDGNSLIIRTNRNGDPALGETAGVRENWIWERDKNALCRMESQTIEVQKADQCNRICASVVEDSNTPPQVVIQDLKTQEIVYTTSLNKTLEQKSRGWVEPILVAPDARLSVKGFLVHPAKEDAGKRYPLIIATYGFAGKTFIADAEWHSSFPAQVLANEGYYVLLLNHCGHAQNLVGDPEKARQIEGWDVLKTFEYAVNMLDRQGLINPDQVGLYGWSHGAFMVEFILSHSNKFHVACVGEGCDWGPGIFFLYGQQFITKIYDNIYGGPPWGDTLKNYVDFCLFFGIDRIRAPLLIESIGGFSISARLEAYVPLRYLHVPAELVIYDKEEHNFVKPKARMASMARKVDWFNYWLLNKPNPEKPEQHERWEKMKSTQAQVTHK